MTITTTFKKIIILYILIVCFYKFVFAFPSQGTDRLLCPGGGGGGGGGGGSFLKNGVYENCTPQEMFKQKLYPSVH